MKKSTFFFSKHAIEMDAHCAHTRKNRIMMNDGRREKWDAIKNDIAPSKKNAHSFKIVWRYQLHALKINENRYARRMDFLCLMIVVEFVIWNVFFFQFFFSVAEICRCVNSRDSLCLDLECIHRSLIWRYNWLTPEPVKCDYLNDVFWFGKKNWRHWCIQMRCSYHIV